jgi:hypothetical protein
MISKIAHVLYPRNLSHHREAPIPSYRSALQKVELLQGPLANRKIDHFVDLASLCKAHAMSDV